MNLFEQQNVNPPAPASEIESFEAALARLEALVSELETGDVPLEKSLQAFEEAQRLIKYCEAKLQSAEKALRNLSRDTDGPAGGETDPS